MDDLDARRGTFRMGVMATAATVMMLSLALYGPLGEIPVLWWVIVGVFGATAIGLLRHARFARVLAGLAFLACAVLAPASTIRSMAASARFLEVDPMFALSIANAAASTLLLVWLCIRAVQILLGRVARMAAITPRIVGGVLATIAVNHLWIAVQPDIVGRDHWSLRLSIDGTAVLGFPGWEVWHIIALALGLILLAGPRAWQVVAATTLTALIALVLPLAAVAVLRTHMVSLEILVLAALGFPLYLSWWLRDELGRAQAPAPPTA